MESDRVILNFIAIGLLLLIATYQKKKQGTTDGCIFSVQDDTLIPPIKTQYAFVKTHTNTLPKHMSNLATAISKQTNTPVVNHEPTSEVSLHNNISTTVSASDKGDVRQKLPGGNTGVEQLGPSESNSNVQIPKAILSKTDINRIGKNIEWNDH